MSEDLKLSKAICKKKLNILSKIIFLCVLIFISYIRVAKLCVESLSNLSNENSSLCNFN